MLDFTSGPVERGQDLSELGPNLTRFCNKSLNFCSDQILISTTRKTRALLLSVHEYDKSGCKPSGAKGISATRRNDRKMCLSHTRTVAAVADG